MQAAFPWASKEGVLAADPLRGVQVTLSDLIVVADAIHRGAGQIISTGWRCIYAALLAASPRFQEPMYKVEILTTEKFEATIVSELEKRRGVLVADECRLGLQLKVLSAILPVEESFGFT